MIQYLKNLFHIVECIAADVFYGFPANKLRVIGVTGTDGKTTTTHAIYHILKKGGKRVSMISSIQATIGDHDQDTGFHTTTPRPWHVRKFLAQAVEAGSRYFVLEVTSHAMEQNRVWGIPFTLAVLTNITHEHLYHHKNFDAYFAAKMKLLIQAKRVVANSDSEIYPQVADFLTKRNRTVRTYSLQSKKADYVWSATLRAPVREDFNKENILAAIACCSLLGLQKSEIEKTILSFQLPKGRLDTVYNDKFTVIVDFAHTPHALERVLSAVKKNYIKHGARLIHVFGAASERDDSKRPLMGSASGRYADIVVVTEEDYRREDIQQIFNQISPGLVKEGFSFVEPKHFASQAVKKTYTTMPNRHDAIAVAIGIARKGDIVIVTGKSHEKSLNRGGVEEPWDEYAAITQALQLKSKVKK